MYFPLLVAMQAQPPASQESKYMLSIVDMLIIYAYMCYFSGVILYIQLTLDEQGLGFKGTVSLRVNSHSSKPILCSESRHW